MGNADLVYFFSGKDDFRKNLSIEKLKTKLALHSNSLDYNIYFSQDIDISDLLNNLQTPPLSSEKRLVVLKSAQKLLEADRDKIISYLKNPAKTSLFIIITNKAQGASDKLNNAAKKYAKCLSFEMLDDNRIASWIKNEFSIEGKAVEQKAIRLLQDNASGDLNLLTQYIKMLCLYAGKRKNITSQDVTLLIGEPAKISIFKLIDYMRLKNQKLALNTVSVLMQSGKNAYEILGLIAWSFRCLGKIKTLLQKDRTKEDLAKALRVSFYAIENMINQAKNFTLEDIKRSQQVIIETDKNLKTSMISKEALLEVLVVRLSSG